MFFFSGDRRDFFLNVFWEVKRRIHVYVCVATAVDYIDVYFVPLFFVIFFRCIPCFQQICFCPYSVYVTKVYPCFLIQFFTSYSAVFFVIHHFSSGVPGIFLRPITAVYFSSTFFKPYIHTYLELP